MPDQTITLVIEGAPRTEQRPQVPPHLAPLVRERSVGSYDLRLPVRGTALPAEKVAAQPDDVLELELDGGLRLWITVADYQKQFEPESARGALPAAIPSQVRVSADFPVAAPQRGVVKWVVKGLKLFGVDVAAGAARQIASAMEQRRGLNGLYGFPFSEKVLTLTENPVFPAGEPPLLVFIHGTMSSTQGSYGALWGARSDVRDRLHQFYGDHIYSFEHRTLTESPLDNAIALAGALPDGARLHLVSHSRGGMVGELLCRCSRVDAARNPLPPFDDADFKLFGGDQGKLRQLAALLSAKQFRIERFLRVACPARGTTLASRRLDRYLSLLDSGLSLADRTGWAADLGWLATSIIKERTDPKTMPGVEAMMPDSATVGMLNRPGVIVAADLRVISGDYAGEGILGRLANWAGETFYDGLNDVVVNTPSMYGGAGRYQGKGWYYFAQGAQVWHFSYFSESSTASRLADGLMMADATAAGFRCIADAPRKDDEIARGIVIDLFAEGIGEKLEGRKPSANGTRPFAVLVPGIMGTHLQVDGDRIWLDVGSLASGGFVKLACDNRSVATDGVVKMPYDDFVRFLSDSHEVLPFPYDWRLSLRDEGARFSSFMADVLTAAEKNGRPVRVVAHSMGGLLVRMAAVLLKEEGGSDWWPRLRALRGSRLLMAGAPNGGSWSVALALTGRADIVRTLAIADLEHDRDTLLNVVRFFEGFLEMLPPDDDYAAFAPATWNQWRLPGETWPAPDAAILAKSRENASLLQRFDFVREKAFVRYLAGFAPQTPTKPTLQDGSLLFGATSEGDGRVLWKTGIPQGIETWYLDVAHGDLLNVNEAFEGVREILETGATALLHDTPPVARGEGAPGAVFQETPVPFYPDTALLVTAAVGGAPARVRQKKARLAEGVLRVCVCNGNLAAARYPVIVGHYVGDTINGSELSLDLRLKGKLTRHHRLGLYPGPEETSAIFLEECGEWGAIVIGLGQVGDLTPRKLTRSFARALLQYALSRSGEEFSVSSLLIGSGAAGWGFGIRESVRALVEGGRLANEMLAQVDGGRTRLSELEILELYEDRALQALHAVRDLSLFGVLPGTDFEGTLRIGAAARCRAMYEESAGWWRRMKIELVGDGLKFTVLSGLARIEESAQPTQRALIDRLIAEAISQPEVSEKEMVTIFNLVTPNALKDRAPDQGDMLLMLDRGAAGYPWEMMHIGTGEKKHALALRHSMVRQLILESYRARPVRSAGMRALVVADPELPPVPGLPQLPGARLEGETVAKALEEGGLAVERAFHANTRAILTSLFDAEYRILHLAGHGVYRFPRAAGSGVTEATGMVLDWKVTGEGKGEPVLLTAVEVRQLLRVPELVFINCCYLGVQAEGERQDLSQLNLFAADIAGEFIEMGALAVIAAGWAVNDNAALTFAGTFYGAMLDGSTFGEAVLAARQAAHKAMPASNTWAAYQCYGDPAYRFRDIERPQRVRVYLAPREAICDVRALAGMRIDESGQQMDVKTLKRELGRIVGVIPHDWFVGNGELRAALGEACAAFGEFAAALEHFRAAVRAQDSGCSLKTLESICHLQARLAESQAKLALEQERDGKVTALEGAGTVKEALDAARAALEEMRFLIERHGETPARCTIIASTFRRVVTISSLTPEGTLPAEVVEENLLYVKDHYQKGATLDGEIDPHLGLKWAAVEILDLLRHEPDQERIKKVAAVLSRCRDKGAALHLARPNFWHGSYVVDADLYLWLLGTVMKGGKKGAPAATVSSFVLRYRELHEKYGKAREIDSVLKQLEFVRLLLPATEPWGAVRGALLKICSGISEPGEKIVPVPVRKVRAQSE